MDVSGSRPAYLLGTAEPEVVQFLREHVRPGDVVLDLGANVGYFTLIAAALTGAEGKVVAYEPIPATAEALRNNVRLNQLTNVDVVEAAVSGEAGTANISLSPSDQQPSLVADHLGEMLTVRTVTLDDEVARVGPPSVIKCDIEGAEQQAFARASSALQTRPAIFCEVHRFKEGDEERLESVLRSHGYETRWVTRSSWISQLVASGQVS